MKGDWASTERNLKDSKYFPFWSQVLQFLG